MSEYSSQGSVSFKQINIANIIRFLAKKWYYFVGAIVFSACIGYIMYEPLKPAYTANFTFVLSTEQKGSNGLAGLASQLGFDATTGSAENIFSGDNIIEFFKSRSLIGAALLSEVDTVSHQTLLNYIAQNNYPGLYEKIGPFNKNPKTYNRAQLNLYRSIISYVSQSFTVFKKDKKLIFYIISARSTNPNIAYLIAKIMLDQTSDYFIATKTRGAATSVQLLKKEADSLSVVLQNTYSSSAAMLDRTYNLNPAITVQRSSSQFNQAKAGAFAASYSEVMRNLELAKMNLQKETPLYRIIDEPELPLTTSSGQTLSDHIFLASVFGFLIMLIAVIGEYFYKNFKKNNEVSE